MDQVRIGKEAKKMPRELFPAFSDAIVSFDEQSEKVRACLTELLDTVKQFIG